MAFPGVYFIIADVTKMLLPIFIFASDIAPKVVWFSLIVYDACLIAFSLWV